MYDYGFLFQKGLFSVREYTNGRFFLSNSNINATVLKFSLSTNIIYLSPQTKKFSNVILAPDSFFCETVACFFSPHNKDIFSTVASFAC